MPTIGDSPIPPNPYAPGVLDDLGATDHPSTPGPSDPNRGFGAFAVCSGTIVVCSVAGALFGPVCVLIVTAYAFFRSDAATLLPDPSSEFLVLAAISAIYGGAMAFGASLLVVPTIFALSLPLRRPGQRWRGPSIRRFATACGLFSGYLPLVVLGGFQGGSSLIALLPAAFGAVVARWLSHPLARRADGDV